MERKATCRNLRDRVASFDLVRNEERVAAHSRIAQRFYRAARELPQTDRLTQSLPLAGLPASREATPMPREPAPSSRQLWRLRSAASSTMRSGSEGLITLPFWQGCAPMIDLLARKLNRWTLR